MVFRIFVFLTLVKLALSFPEPEPEPNVKVDVNVNVGDDDNECSEAEVTKELNDLYGNGGGNGTALEGVCLLFPDKCRGGRIEHGVTSCTLDDTAKAPYCWTPPNYICCLKV